MCVMYVEGAITSDKINDDRGTHSYLFNSQDIMLILKCLRMF